MNKNILSLKAIYLLAAFLLSTAHLSAVNPFAQAKKDLRTINDYLRMPDHGGINAQDFRTALARVGLSLAAIIAITAGGAVVGYKIIKTKSQRGKIQKALLQAINDDDLESVKTVLEEQANATICDKKGNSLLMLAIANGKENIIQYLLTIKDIDINAQNNEGSTALIEAIEKNNATLVTQLINKGANVNIADKNGFTPLIMATINAKNAIATELINNGADINAQNNEGDTALIRAIKNNDKDKVLLLINNNANVNQINKKGESPLISASRYGLSLDTIDLLLEKGALINAQDNNGWTALMWAIDQNEQKIAESLIKKEANVNLANKTGETPLMKAASKGLVDLIELLLTNKAIINAVDHKGKTALMYAAEKGKPDAVSLLIKNHANVTIKSKEHKTAKDYAVNIATEQALNLH